MKIGDKVRVTEVFLDDYPDFAVSVADREGVIIGESAAGCIHDKTWEVEFTSGISEWIYPCDLEVIESESPYEEELNEDEVYDLLERAQAVRDEYDLVSR